MIDVANIKAGHSAPVRLNTVSSDSVRQVDTRSHDHEAAYRRWSGAPDVDGMGRPETLATVTVPSLNLGHFGLEADSDFLFGSSSSRQQHRIRTICEARAQEYSRP